MTSAVMEYEVKHGRYFTGRDPRWGRDVSAARCIVRIAARQGLVSAGNVRRVYRLARTIADLDGPRRANVGSGTGYGTRRVTIAGPGGRILSHHIAEALQYEELGRGAGLDGGGVAWCRAVAAGKIDEGAGLLARCLEIVAGMDGAAND